MASISTAELRILITAQDYASAQLARTVSGFNSLAQKATMTGSQMTRAFTLPAGVIGGSIIKEAADFEQTLDVLVNTTREAGNNVQDAANGFGDAETRMAAFRKEALALGADLNIPATSASDAARAMDELAKAGLSATQVLAAARGTVQLAAAMNVDEAKAADLMSAALKAFRLPGEDAVRVTNMIARATEVSRAKFDDFAIGIRQGAAAFAVTGRPLEEFLGMIGILVDRGVSGGVAATSLRRAVSAVAAPTAKATATMEKYGVSLFDAEGKMKSWPDIIDHLSESFKDLNPQETFAAIKNIFGQEGFKSIAPLIEFSRQQKEAMDELNASFEAGEISQEEYAAAQARLAEQGKKTTDELRANIESIKNSDAAAKITEARTKGLNGAIDGLVSSFQTMAIVIGTPFLQRLNNLARGFAELITKFGEFMSANPRLLEFVATFGTVIAAVGPALLIFGRLLTLIGALATPFGLATAAIATFAAAWSINLGNVQGITHDALGGVVKIMAGLGERLREWGAENEPLGEMIGKVLSGIGGIAQGFQFAIQGNMEAAKKAWSDALGDFGKAGEIALQQVDQFVGGILDKIGELTGIDVSGATTAIDKLATLLGIDTSDSVDGLTRLWQILDRLGQLSLGGLTTIWNTLKELGSLTFSGLDKFLDFSAKLSGMTFSAPDLSPFDKFKELALADFGPLVDLLARLQRFTFSAPDLSTLDKLKELGEFNWNELKDFFNNLMVALPKLNIPGDFARALENIRVALEGIADLLSSKPIQWEKATPPPDAGQRARQYAADLKFLSATLVTTTGAFAESINMVRGFVIMADSLMRVLPLLGQAAKDVLTGTERVGADSPLFQAREIMQESNRQLAELGSQNDAAKKRTQDAWDEYFNFIKQGGIDTANEVAAAQQKTTQAVDGTSEAVKAATVDLGESFADIPAQTDEMATAIEQGLAPIPAAVTDTLDPVAQQVTEVSAEAAQAMVDQLASLPANVSQATGDIITTIDQVQPQAQESGTGLGQAVIDGISAALSLTATPAFAEELPTQIQAVEAPAHEAGTAVGTAVVTGLEEGVKPADTALAPLSTSVEQSMNTTLATVQSSGAQIIASFTTTFQQIVAAVTAAMAQVTATITTSAQQQVAAMQAAGAQILASAQATWQAILASATSTWATITQTVVTSANQTQAAVVAAGQQMTVAINAAGNSMIAAMSNAMSGMVSAATSGIAQVISAVSGQAAAAASAGASIGNSIASGLSSAIQAGAARAASAAAAAVNAAISAARAAADAHSPSRKMTQLGTDMIDGLANALSQGQSRVADAVKIIIKEALAANIDPMVALALAKAESSLNARARGDSGHSVGLFQLHDAGQGAGMSVAAREDPTTNARKFLQSHSQLFAQLKGQIKDTTELVRQFGVAAEQPADQTGAAYVAAYQQIQQQIRDAGGSIADLVDNQDAFNTALGESVDTTASLTPLLERQLALKEQSAALDVKMLAGQQNLERINRAIQQVEEGSIEQRLAAMQGSRQDNAYLQQELQLKLQLLKAQRDAGVDSKGKPRETQEIADIKAALDLLKDQREEISLNAALTKAENEARSMGLKEQALLQGEALRPLQNQQFLLQQQLAQIDALNAAWQAAQATIQNNNSAETAARREVIATMREQAGANTNIVSAGQAALTEMRNSGRITQQEFERYMGILQQFGQVAVASTNQAATGITTIATASTNAQTAIVNTGAALTTTGQEMQAVGQAGAQAGQVLATNATQGLTQFANEAAVAAQNAVNSVINVLLNSGGAAYEAGRTLGNNVGAGLTDGIVESGNAAIDAAIQVANAVIEAMRGPQGFDAHSPARKSYFIGQDVMAGLIKGLNDPTIGEDVKKRIQQYIDMAERYRKLIPEAIDNEMRIIETRIDQAKALLGILDLEMRMKEAQRAAEDARRGSLTDQIRLLDIERDKNELRLKELDHAKKLTAAQRDVEATERAIQEIVEGTLAERIAALQVEQQQNILKRQQLVLQQQMAVLSAAVHKTEREIQETQDGSIATQEHLLDLDYQRGLIRQQELMHANELLDAQNAVADTERIIRDLERGTLAERQAEITLDHKKNLLSKERIQIEARLRQIHEAGIAKDIAAFSGQGLQVVDPSDATQQEVNALHNRLAVIEDQNELLTDEGEIRRLNGQIASYEYRLQLEAQRDSVDVLEHQNELLERQSQRLQNESELVKLNGELASHYLQVRLLHEQAALKTLQDQIDAIEAQNDALDLAAQLRAVDAAIASNALKIQLEQQKEALKVLEQQQQVYDDQNQALDEEAERIRINNELRAHQYAVEAVVLEDEHRQQQRIIDDLDRQYEALNRQKQVYDAILRAVDYLHDHLLDIGILEDPFAQPTHEPTPHETPGGSGGGRSGGSAGGAARAGGAVAAAGEAIGKSMKDAGAETEKFVGNAQAALARLKPVVTDAATTATTALAGTATAGHQIAIELGDIGSRDFKVNVDGTTIREAQTTAGYLMDTTGELASQTYDIKVNDQTVRVSGEQAIALRESIEGVADPVSLNVNGQQVTLTGAEVAILRDQLAYVNSERVTLSVEDQAVKDAEMGVSLVTDAITTLDGTTAAPAVVPEVDTAPIEEMVTEAETERVMAVASEVDTAAVDDVVAVVEADHTLAAATEVDTAAVDTTIATITDDHTLPSTTTVDTAAVDSTLATVEANHDLPATTVVDRATLDTAVTVATTNHPMPMNTVVTQDTMNTTISTAATVHPVNMNTVVTQETLDAAIALGEEPHPLNMNTVVVLTEMEAAITEADAQHPLNMETIVVLDEMEAAIAEAVAQHPLNMETIVVLDEMEAAISEADAQHPLNMETVVVLEEMQAAIDEAAADHDLNITTVVERADLDTAIEDVEAGYDLAITTQVERGDLDSAISDAEKSYDLAVKVKVEDDDLQDVLDDLDEDQELSVAIKMERDELDDVLEEIKKKHTMKVEVEKTGGGGEGEGHATGGVVQSGRAITVGEFGRETFVPWTKGYIMPHQLTERLMDANRARQMLAPAMPGRPNQQSTVNNFNVTYTAVEQKKKGEADINQVLRDTVMLLSIGGS